MKTAIIIKKKIENKIVNILDELELINSMEKLGYNSSILKERYNSLSNEMAKLIKIRNEYDKIQDNVESMLEGIILDEDDIHI